MNLLSKVINSYLNYGDSKIMEKVRKYLSENFDFHNLTPSYIQSFPILEVAHQIGLYFFKDIKEIQNPKSKEKHIEIISKITKMIFIEFFKIIKTNESNEAALTFVTECENAFDEANTVHEGLDRLIATIPFEEYKDKCLDIIAPIIVKNKVYFDWKIPLPLLRDLSYSLHKEYSIIRAPSRFEKLMQGNSNIRLTVNENKVGYFVFLMRCLLGNEFEGKYKYIEVAGGKGYWKLLEQITYDFQGELLANHERYFNNLSTKMAKKNRLNENIIKEIEAILEEIHLKR